MSDAKAKADPKKDDKKDAGPIKGLGDDDAGSAKPLKLSSKDKKEFTVERKHAFISTLVKTSLENDDKAEEVPIPGVTGAILELVVNYMKEHKGVEPPIIEKPLRSKVMKDVCPHKWDADYIDKIGETRQQLYDLILAANYMDIKSLLHLGCAKVASLIKGQPLEKIKEILDPNQDPKKADAKAADKKAETKAAPKEGEAAAAERKSRAPFRKFFYRGLEVHSLLDLTHAELMKLMTSRVRRRFARGQIPMGLVRKLRKEKNAAAKSGEKPRTIKTHHRNMIIVPEMVGSMIGVYNGLNFTQVEVKPDMIGHYLGEFAITYKPVKHGRAGVGATSTAAKFIPLK